MASILKNKWLCYSTGTARRTCQYRKACNRWMTWHTAKVIKLLQLNGHTAYQCLFVDYCFNVFILDRFQNTTTFEVIVTACDFENFIFWQRSLNYKPCVLSNLCVNISYLNHTLFMSNTYWKVSDNKNDLQTHSRSSTVMPFDSHYITSYLSSIVTMSLCCTVSEILSLI